MSFTRTTMIAATTAAALATGTIAAHHEKGEHAEGKMEIAETTGPVIIGGAEMLPTNNIVENALLSADHKTLVAAVQAAGLVETLSGPGPFTVFAPNDDAFARVPEATLSALMEPTAKDQLAGILTYHVVSGKLMASDVLAAIQAGGGTATLTTVAGGTLTAEIEGQGVKLTDANGGVAYVSTVDAAATNGVVHEINSVLLP